MNAIDQFYDHINSCAQCATGDLCSCGGALFDQAIEDVDSFELISFDDEFNK